MIPLLEWHQVGTRCLWNIYFKKGKVATQDIQNEDYVNHSCDGNMWFDGSDVSYPIFIIYKDKYGKLIAKRDIKQGEELTYDYAMTEASNGNWSSTINAIDFRIECLCNSTNCRKIVTGSDYLIPEIRKQYEGHFLPHIRKKIKHFDEQKKSWILQ